MYLRLQTSDSITPIGELVYTVHYSPWEWGNILLCFLIIYRYKETTHDRTENKILYVNTVNKHPIDNRSVRGECVTYVSEIKSTQARKRGHQALVNTVNRHKIANTIIRVGTTQP